MRVLIYMELLRLLRGRGVLLWLILPSLLLVPLVIAGSMIYERLSGEDVVAISDAPFEVEETLQDAGLNVVYAPDPLAALEAGEVDAAVVHWMSGDGIGEARPEHPFTGWRWRVSVVSEDEGYIEEIEDALDEAGDEWLEDIVVASGGVVDRDLWLARIFVLKNEGEPKKKSGARLQSPIVFFFLQMGLLGGVFFLSVMGIADRNQGVSEQFQVAPVPEGTVMLARLVALTLMELLAAAALVANFVVVVGASVPLGVYMAGGLSLTVGFLLINTASLLLGEWSESIEQLVNLTATPLVLGGTALLFFGNKSEMAWVPLGGLINATAVHELAVAVLSSLSATAGLFLLTIWVQRRKGRA